jgi:hypothetical protein
MKVEASAIQQQNGLHLSIFVRKARGLLYYYPPYSLRAATISGRSV